jgi:hypothetical protein
MAKIRLTLSDSWQYFAITELPANQLHELKIRIIDNFGDCKSYLSKVSLFYAEQHPKDPNNPTPITQHECQYTSPYLKTNRVNSNKLSKSSSTNKNNKNKEFLMK